MRRPHPTLTPHELAIMKIVWRHEDGATVFRAACKLGLEGIISKRKDSRVSGRSPHWV